MSDLLPCPLCGGKSELEVYGATGYSYIKCQKCGLETIGYYDDKTAVEAWNTRAESTCEDAGTRFNAWVCSECKATLLLSFDDYGEPSYSVDGVADVPRYCPNCGAKVVG